MRFTSKMKLSYRDRSKQVQSVTKTRQDNDMTDRTGTIHAKNENELSGSIILGVIYDKNQIGQRCEQSYSSSLR